MKKFIFAMIVAAWCTGMPCAAESPGSGNFGRVLVLSNSFGAHGLAPQIGWYGDGWGMAADRQENDFAHRLVALMQTVNPEAELVGVRNISDFEINHQDPEFDYSQYDTLNALDFDCMVIKIGENSGPKHEGMGEHLIELMDGHIAKGKSAKIFVASLFEYSEDTADFQSVPMNRELCEAARHFGTVPVMINRNGGPYGDRYNALHTPLPPKPDGTQPDKQTEVISGVTVGHPGNEGMLMIAEEFWKAMNRSLYGCLHQ